MYFLIARRLSIIEFGKCTVAPLKRSRKSRKIASNMQTRVMKIYLLRMWFSFVEASPCFSRYKSKIASKLWPMLSPNLKGPDDEVYSRINLFPRHIYHSNWNFTRSIQHVKQKTPFGVFCGSEPFPKITRQLLA